MIERWDWSKIRVRELELPGLPKKGQLFAVVPLARAMEAMEAMNCQKAMVWLWLLQQTRRTRSDRVTVSNETLAKYGVSRKQKYLALRQLEGAGLIIVKQRGRNAPVVRVVR